MRCVAHLKDVARFLAHFSAKMTTGIARHQRGRVRKPNLEDLSESPLIRVASRVAPRGAKRRPKKILTSETSKTQEIARLRAHTHTYLQGQRGLS